MTPLQAFRKAHDPWLPRGYRHLLNLFDEATATEARRSLVRIFGEDKGYLAKIVRGAAAECKWAGQKIMPAWRCYLPEA